MNSLKIALLAISLSNMYGIAAQTAPKPIIAYNLSNINSESSKVKLNGNARIVSINGKQAINMVGIKSALELKQHNLNNKKGSLALWVAPLEDISNFPDRPTMFLNNPDILNYVLLSDNPNYQDYKNSNFKFTWWQGRSPQLHALFAKGIFYDEAFNFPHKAKAVTGHFFWDKERWYQLVLNWDHDKREYTIFANGVKVGSSDTYYPDKFYRDSVGKSLYLGLPLYCYNSIEFFDEPLTVQQAYSKYRKEVTDYDKTYDDKLKYTYGERVRKTVDFFPDKSWTKKTDLTLTQSSDLDSFYIQGLPVQTAITKDGLLAETIDSIYTGSRTPKQMYIWLWQPYEGDLYVEYEFKILRRGGLSLLMTQASAMNREDFMRDYPLRTSGKMTMVHGEDIRNYQWEYYRDMVDVRNDVATSILVKNPWNYRLSYGCDTGKLESDKWHKLQLIQRGNHIMGLMDGKLMVETTDNGFSNHGPVLNTGHIAIRLMLHSKLLFRNLKVYNKSNIKTISEIKK